MAPKYCWHDPEGLRTIAKIVKEQIPQWKDGLYPSQDNLVRRVLNGEAILCCMATGGGKSALFAVPILILCEMSRNRHLCPDLPIRALPQGIVVTPTNGLAANIVLELGKLGIPAFAYCHETVTAARKAGRNLVHEICECKTWNVICVDPEHLRDSAWREITAFTIYCSNIVYSCVDEAHLINISERTRRFLDHNHPLLARCSEDSVTYHRNSSSSLYCFRSPSIMPATFSSGAISPTRNMHDHRPGVLPMQTDTVGRIEYHSEAEAGPHRSFWDDSRGGEKLRE
ncbi:hypothetical protein B0H13DRAFT_2019988 [Mycena leptocephala]|nr:hypothetical protein B0H13DRAFT_2019988 [Mycena leptocephala]